MHRPRTYMLPPLVIVALAACAPELELLEGAGSIDAAANPKIYGGSAPDETWHDAVVAIHQQSSRGVHATPFCTGTLIGEEWVLTAAHCVTTGVGGVVPASKIAIYVGDDPSADLASHLYDVAAVIRHARYDEATLYNDIALLELSTPVTEVDAVPWLPSSAALSSADVGTDLNFVGFGYDEAGGYGVKLQVDLPLDGFGCAVDGCVDAGNPFKQLSYSQDESASGVGPCSGDSGGPAFVIRGGAPYVAGITSYGDTRCVRYGVSTRVDNYAGWIKTQTGL